MDIKMCLGVWVPPVKTIFFWSSGTISAGAGIGAVGVGPPPQLKPPPAGKFQNLIFKIPVVIEFSKYDSLKFV